TARSARPRPSPRGRRAVPCRSPCSRAPLPAPLRASRSCSEGRRERRQDPDGPPTPGRGQQGGRSRRWQRRRSRRRADDPVPVAAGAAADRRRRPQPVRQRLRQRPGRPLPRRPGDDRRRPRRGAPAAGDGRRRRLRAIAMALPKPVVIRPSVGDEGTDEDGGHAREHAHAHAHEAGAPHGGRYDDILDAIGHTPLVEIPRMSPVPAVRIFAKLEMTNPTGSVKDRAAKYLIEDLETHGLLREDSIILEPTSGNTGIALAMIGRRKGYRVALVMPDNVTNERRQMAALFGAE